MLNPPSPSPVSTGTWHLHDALTGHRRVEQAVLVVLCYLQSSEPRQQAIDGPHNANTTLLTVPSKHWYLCARLPDPSDMCEQHSRANARMLRPPPYKSPIQVLKRASQIPGVTSVRNL